MVAGQSAGVRCGASPAVLLAEIPAGRAVAPRARPEESHPDDATPGPVGGPGFATEWTRGRIT